MKKFFKGIVEYFKINTNDKPMLINTGATILNSAVISLCLLPTFASATDAWRETVNKFLNNEWMFLYCFIVFILFLAGLECLAMGIEKKNSITVIIFMIINALLSSGIVGKQGQGWLLTFFIFYSIFMGTVTWKVEKWVFTLIKNLWYKIPIFSDTAQVALIVGLVTPVITILANIMSKIL